MYDYAKYENATRKDIIKALNLAEKKEKKLNEQLKENRIFFKFLQKKLQNSFSVKRGKYNGSIPNDETIKALKNATSIGVFNNFDEAKKALMSDD